MALKKLRTDDNKQLCTFYFGIPDDIFKDVRGWQFLTMKSAETLLVDIHCPRGGS